MDLSGTRLGHIQVHRILGQGGMGEVYEGFDEKLARRVALKALHRVGRLDDTARSRLIREARALSQLEHPNICRIHDYIEGDDADVLVLEYIEGRTLQAVVEEGLSRAEKLRIAQAIAEVLVVAHRASILHRDLKPENVMLTKDGTVKVLDFGLAHWIERASTGKRRVARISRIALDNAKTWHRFELDPADVPDTPPAATGAGMTVGTPMFMSPEQARGERLTPASDMYSFGLLLQALFTSADPYPSSASGVEVMTMAARGESLPIIGVPHDVAALINGLKALAPTDRPTAVETLAKLRLLADKPKRLTRRALLAAALMLVVFGSWKYTVDLRSERAAAVEAKQEAILRRGQAEDLVSFIVGDLRKKLEAVGRLDVLDAAATKAYAYAGSLQPTDMTKADLLRTSEALNQLGDVRIGQGNLGEARRVFELSLRMSHEAARRAPADPSAALAVGTSHFWIGNAYRLDGDLAHALEHMKAYSDAAEKVRVAAPDNPKYRMEVAYGHSVVGTILEAEGDLKEALRQYQTTLRIKSELLAETPSDVERQIDVATTLDKIGFVRQRLGDLDGAQNDFQSEFAIRSQLAARNPTQMHWQWGLAISHNYLGALLQARGDVDGAMQHHLAELKIDEELTSHDPANADWQRDRAIAEMRVGDLYLLRGDHAQAIARIDSAEQQIRALLAHDPTRKSWQRDLGVVYTTRARVLLARRAFPSAEEAAGKSVDLLTPQTDPAGKRLFGDSCVVLGDVLAGSGRREDARAVWSRGRAALEPMASAASDPQLLDVWAALLERLGDNARANAAFQRLAATGYRSRELLQSRH